MNIINNEENVNQGIINCRASDVITLLKSKDDRRNFCIEMNWNFPNERGFDTTFLLNVMAGKKKLLPLGFGGGLNLSYFKKGETLSKKYIVDKMMGDLRYGEFVPDKINPLDLSREFLLTLIAYVNPALYIQLETIAKEQKSQRNFNKWNNYNIKLTQDVYNKLREFEPIKNTKKNSKAFRLTNKGQNTGIFQTIPNQVGNIDDDARNHNNNIEGQGQNIGLQGNQNEEINNEIQANEEMN